LNRADKTAALESAAEAFRQTPNVLVADFRGLTANQSADLRRRIRAAGGTFTVVKNRLAKKASEGTAVERLRPSLVGPCGLASHRSDPVVLAKVLTDFAKDNPQLKIVTAIVDGKDVLDAQAVKALSALPGLPELRATLLALLNTPATMLTRILATPGQQVARAVDARREKLETNPS
jgi:large subunit ribosomal protein L10